MPKKRNEDMHHKDHPDHDFTYDYEKEIDLAHEYEDDEYLNQHHDNHHDDHHDDHHDKHHDDHHNKHHDLNLCQKFADILDSKIIESKHNLCVVTRVRDIDVKIKGRPTNSPLAINALFSFESKDEKGRTLNLGETVILQREINLFILSLREQGIKITALHNHWLFEEPRLFYIYFLSIEHPLSFARKVAKAFRMLEDSLL